VPEMGHDDDDDVFYLFCRHKNRRRAPYIP
jgi:hypothetical protein